MTGTDIQTNRQADEQTGSDGQADRWTDRLTDEEDNILSQSDALTLNAVLMKYRA